MTIRVRLAEPGDASAGAAIRLALWSDDNGGGHEAEVARFCARAEGEPVALLPEAVLVATIDQEKGEALVGFAELSRRACAEGCATSPVGRAPWDARSSPRTPSSRTPRVPPPIARWASRRSR